jgi:predicted Zn-dependent peptidase
MKINQMRVFFVGLALFITCFHPVFSQNAPVKKATKAPVKVAPKAGSSVQNRQPFILDRSKKPAPGPAPVINLAKAEQWTLDNGLKVFFVRDTKLPRITYQLSLDYDPILEGEYAGYVSIAGELIGSGTESLTKDQLDEEIDFLGATVNTSASGVYGFGLSKYADRIIEIMSDVVTHPRMDNADLERIRKRTLSGLAVSKTDPSAISRRVMNRMMYGTKHPFGEYSTEESVKKVTLEKCKEF